MRFHEASLGMQSTDLELCNLLDQAFVETCVISTSIFPHLLPSITTACVVFAPANCEQFKVEGNFYLKHLYALWYDVFGAAVSPKTSRRSPGI